jgi:hypothetical protein
MYVYLLSLFGDPAVKHGIQVSQYSDLFGYVLLVHSTYVLYYVIRMFTTYIGIAIQTAAL